MVGPFLLLSGLGVRLSGSSGSGENAGSGVLGPFRGAEGVGALNKVFICSDVFNEGSVDSEMLVDGRGRDLSVRSWLTGDKFLVRGSWIVLVESAGGRGGDESLVGFIGSDSSFGGGVFGDFIS